MLARRSADAGTRVSDAGSVAFQLGPRINAAGRLQDAMVGVHCLLAEDRLVADRLAAQLDAENRARRAEQQRVIDEALARVESEDGHRDARALVLYDEGWHPGVIGIAVFLFPVCFVHGLVVAALLRDLHARNAPRWQLAAVGLPVGALLFISVPLAVIGGLFGWRAIADLFAFRDPAGTGFVVQCLATGAASVLEAARFCHVPSATLNDTHAPTAGTGNFYLVTGLNGAGESSLGETSNGAGRPNAHPCP